ncbi:MAG TPA: riboflavin synthase [Terriglobales bacterium]|jgi:riboflavin synthase|nr:riboflavin synthase [Terriglobales bacterium]
MFTGLIEEVGRVEKIKEDGGKRRLTISASRLPSELKIGDSISVSGTCLTAVEVHSQSFAADLAAETWARTSFSRIRQGALVNLELPMRADGRFGGHLVQGHVDGTGKFLGLEPIPGGNDFWLRLEIPSDLERYVVHKGSLSVEGISLTVAKLEGNTVTIAIIPHTIEMTNLKSLRRDDPLNLEVDLVAKYVEKMVRGEEASAELTVERLMAEGF